LTFLELNNFYVYVGEFVRLGSTTSRVTSIEGWKLVTSASCIVFQDSDQDRSFL